MQRLILLKLIPQHLATTSPCSSKSLFHFYKTSPNHFISSRQFFTHSPSYVHASNIWRPSNTISHKIHSFFSVSTVLKRGVLTAIGRKGSQRLLYKKPTIQSTRSIHINYGSRRSSWSSGVSPDNVILGLIVANVAVYMLWRIADQTFMMKNFMISLDNVKSGRVHTIITSAFSHIDTGHIISNMIGLYFFGTSIGRSFGTEYFLKLYFTGALVGSVFFLIHQAFIKGGLNNSGGRGLGASGAVNAILLLDIFMFPKKTLLLDFFIPVPAVLLGIYILGKDIQTILEGNSHISGSAHLGGAAVAAVAWFQLRRGRSGRRLF